MSPPSTSTAIGSSSAERPVRTWHRLPLLAGWSATAFLAWGTGTLLTLPARGARDQVRRAVFRVWARGVVRILGIRVAVEGTAPEPPFLLVSNHLSYLDIVVFAATGPARFVAKREVRDWPVVGLLARTMRTVFINRTVKRDAVRALEGLADAVGDGDGVIVFAEATSSAGHRVLPFRPALLEWAARTGYPVHYASIAYRTPPGTTPAHLSVCWWGDMTFGRHLVALCRLPWIGATLRHGEAPVLESDRKRLADRLHRAVAAQFSPVVMEQG